jgi:hypothetical protein
LYRLPTYCLQNQSRTRRREARINQFGASFWLVHRRIILKQLGSTQTHGGSLKYQPGRTVAVIAIIGFPQCYSGYGISGPSELVSEQANDNDRLQLPNSTVRSSGQFPAEIGTFGWRLEALTKGTRQVQASIRQAHGDDAQLIVALYGIAGGHLFFKPGIMVRHDGL